MLSDGLPAMDYFHAGMAAITGSGRFPAIPVHGLGFETWVPLITWLPPPGLLPVSMPLAQRPGEDLGLDPDEP